ncbi:chloride channel protein [Sulfuriflexus mobilis]|uniref:chloride channel protein n=1 Tax=Sulfuriflexus mobilis TaxID=1811807 RepID=UPI000F838697|nr:chloride channel protein [Sulfuriflexus mobilis]
MNRWLDNLRLRLASVDALLLLAALGLIVGLLAGGVTLLFRLLVEVLQGRFLAHPEGYEALGWQARLFLPLGGGVVIGVVLQLLKQEDRSTGIVHVMERLNYHEGHLPLRNILVQFFGAATSLVSGHSVGREGPSVHLGAGSGSVLGQVLRLPNNSIRSLVACGAAAAIAASFNTPLAGVIFAMEVILLEYTLSGFVPVILAAVSATVLSRAVYGADAAFSVPAFELASLLEMPWILVMGLVIGGIAASFNGLLNRITTLSSQWPILVRCSLGGLLTGLLALLAPEIMGVGYDTITTAMLGQLGIGVLASILLLKLIATALAIGLGIPGGLIAPSLVLGGMVGGIAGITGAHLMPGTIGESGMYVMIGMAAMMAAVLNAPLAALLALLELTGNPNIILPGMLAVITATLTHSELFGRQSVFIMLLRARGLDYRHNPFAQGLRRIGIASLADHSFVRHAQAITTEQARVLLTEPPRWVLVENEQGPVALLPGGDLAHALEVASEGQTLDLLAIPGQRLQLTGIHQQATLQEAMGRLDAEQAEALYIWRPSAPQILRIEGVVTREAINKAWRGVPG